jgi:methionyl aminopeptidase
MTVHIKSPAEIALMREAGRVTAIALAEIRSAIKPGVKTSALDEIAVKVFQKFGAKPAFLGYPPNSKHPFPASINVCINEELVHGIPTPHRILQEGDIVSIDTACHYKGYVGDAAFTMAVGAVPPAVQKLIEDAEKALHIGIQASQAGRKVSDVAKAIHAFAHGEGYSVVKEYCGHGVGRKMHEEPSVPNWWPDKKDRAWRNKYKDMPLRMGMTYAIEPMISLGSADTAVLDDEWTVVMQDGALCAHFEHTIAVVDKQAIILTLP